MAGLLAARVLSDAYEQVIVLDRDYLPAAAVRRAGVPQALHLHGLLARGRDILEELFPGLGAELLALGAVSADLQRDIRWFIDGHPMRRATSGLDGLSMSRVLLESRIRGRVSMLPGVCLKERCEIAGLVADDDGRRVTGVRVVDLAHGNAERLWSSRLVVDASGRGSRSPMWLRELGYAPPDEDKVRIGMAYATRRYRREPHHLPDSKGAVVTLSLDNPRGGAVAAEENDRWIVTLAGILGDSPPLDPAGFAAFAATLPDPKIADVIAAAEPLGEPLRARFPASVRRRYEKLSRFPEGYLVVGDAICSFNPVYSQGMTVAAEETLLLRSCLAKGRDGLARQFFRKTARMLAVPWSMAVGGDLRFKGVEGRRTLTLRAANWYLGSLGPAVERDPVVGRTLLRIANLLDKPPRLVAPDIAVRVLRAHLSGAGSSPGASAHHAVITRRERSHHDI